MHQNYAWFAQRSGPPNENWRMVNSLFEVSEQARAAVGVRTPDELFFEWGTTGGPKRSLPVKMTGLGQLLFAMDAWMATLPAGPVFVYGRRNIFEPLMYHWRRTRKRPDRPQMFDILETLIVPESVPTLRDRNGVDRAFASWLTDSPALTPLDFFTLIQPSDPTP